MGGVPEPPESYLNYCCTEGRFRMEHVPVPTTAQAVQDLRTLLDSEAWKAIKWKDRGQGFQYELSDQPVVAYLCAQAR